MSNNLIKQRADAQFKKLPGIEEGKSAQSEYEAAADALSAKIAGLKELRLARDAAALAAAPAAPVKKVRKKKSQKKRPAVSLSDWLKSRHTGGHNS